MKKTAAARNSLTQDNSNIIEESTGLEVGLIPEYPTAYDLWLWVQLNVDDDGNIVPDSCEKDLDIKTGQEED